MHSLKTPSLRGRGSHAILYLNGKAVGKLTVKGWDTSWGFGDFTPADDFSDFAIIFGRWSLLMHEDAFAKLDPQIRGELAHAESQLDNIKARLFFPADSQWVDVAQLTIDGELLEWKEY